MGMDNGKKHIPLSEMDDVLSGATTMDDAMKTHLSGCLNCRSEMRWLESLWGFGKKEQNGEPPDWAVSNAINVFQQERPNLVIFAKETVAKPVGESFSEPLPEGVRQGHLPTRQTLYQADGLQLDIEIQLSEEKGTIIGQVLGEDVAKAPRRLRVDLNQEGESVRSSETNDGGQFIFEDLPQGNYEILISFPGRLVMLPPVTIKKS